jgi:hypothetical protein
VFPPKPRSHQLNRRSRILQGSRGVDYHFRISAGVGKKLIAEDANFHIHTLSRD